MANPVMWFEVMGKDSAGLQRFYREVFGWKMTPPVKEMGNYSMLERPDTGIGGGFGEGDARVSVYVEVADPQRFVDKAVSAGATMLMPVTQITPTTTIAMLLDPAGNTFGVMKPPSAPRKTRKRTTASKTTRPRTKSTAARGRTSAARPKTRPKKRTRRSS
jgi:predicted enzyme related to lactoylglutathione lyase